MSYFMEIVVKEPTQIAGLTEVKFTWGGEDVVVETPRYEFRGLLLHSYPVPEHVRRELPTELRRVANCLHLPGTVPLDWAAGALRREELDTLEALFLAVGQQPCWAVVCDGTQGDDSFATECEGAEIFRQVNEFLASRNEGFLILTPQHRN